MLAPALAPPRRGPSNPVRTHPKCLLYLLEDEQVTRIFKDSLLYLALYICTATTRHPNPCDC